MNTLATAWQTGTTLAEWSRNSKQLQSICDTETSIASKRDANTMLCYNPALTFGNEATLLQTDLGAQRREWRQCFSVDERGGVE